VFALSEENRPASHRRPRPPRRRKVSVDKALVKKTNYLLSARQIQRLIDEGHIACPKCGGTKLIWACCGVNVADPDLLKKLREEVKKG